MNAPNQITVARIVFIPLFIYFLLSAQQLFVYKILAVVSFFILAGTDFIDGYLARKFNQKTQFGALFDPLADKLLVYSAFLIFVETGKLWAIFVILMLARDFLVMGIRVWAAKTGKIIAASESGKLKTFSQMLAIIFMILELPFWNLIFLISLLLCLYSGWEYYKQIDFGEI